MLFDYENCEIDQLDKAFDQLIDLFKVAPSVIAFHHLKEGYDLNEVVLVNNKIVANLIECKRLTLQLEDAMANTSKTVPPNAEVSE